MMTDHIDDTTHCPVCYEAYEESGDNMPRILPCYHTLCEKCVGELIERKSLTCPQDRKKHAAVNGVKSFSQNKYIVTNLVRKAGAQFQFEICKQHGREVSLYCREPRCQKPICSMCLISEHKTHSIVDVLQEQEEQAEKLFGIVKLLTTQLQSYKTKVLTLKKKLKHKFTIYEAQINKGREEIIKRYEKLLKDTTDCKNKVNVNIDDEMASIDERIIMLDSIKENTSHKSTCSEMITRLEIMRSIESSLARDVTYKYLEFKKPEVNADDLERVCGSLKEKEASLVAGFRCKGKYKL